MSQPGNTPPDCPRLLVGGSGPRSCSIVACACHLRGATSRGPVSSRARLAVLVDDTCAKDVSERAKRSGPIASNVYVSYRELAVLLGTTPQAAERSCVSGLRKLKLAMR